MRTTTTTTRLVLAIVALVTLPRLASAQDGRVIGLELIRGGSDTVVASLFDGAIITIPPGANPSFGVKAVTAGSPIQSVIFGWNNVPQYRVESSAPYALCGNDGPIFFRCSRMLLGTHTVRATISNNPNRTISATFQIVTNNTVVPTTPVSAPTLPSPTLMPVVMKPPNMTFFLIYTVNNSQVMELRSGSVVDLSQFPTPSFNIRADTTDPSINSVRFLPTNQPETARPFAYCGNSGPIYYTCPSLSSPGLVTVVVEPFTERFQAGEQLPNVVLSFTIRNNTLPVSPAPIAVPVPVPNSKAPTKTPTKQPTQVPTKTPTKQPTRIPTMVPTTSPTGKPVQTAVPTLMKTPAPTTSPTETLSVVPTEASVTNRPTKQPTRNPTAIPTRSPTRSPILAPMKTPTKQPTKTPTKMPTKQPTRIPTAIPTRSPTRSPILVPMKTPTKQPTKTPTKTPTKQPTSIPTMVPATNPTGRPIQVVAPTTVPTNPNNITFTLVYTLNNTDIVTLVDGMIINASNFEALSFSVRADSASTNVQSVQFFPIDRGETSKPWAYCGNAGPVYSTCDDFSSGGNITVTARPYSGTGQTGTQYPDVSVSFSFVGATTPSSGFPIRINCGGGTVTDSIGQKWSADSFFTGGGTYSTSAAEISNTDNDVIYRSERSNTFVYNIPVPLGSYSVVLHFAEIFFTTIGQRVFDIDVEGTLIADIDIIDRAEGRANNALMIDTPVAVADGFLTIRGLTNEPTINFAKISAIEVIVIGSHYSHAVTGGPYTAVDTDNDGFALVAVDGSESHTHGPNQELVTFEWKRNNVVVGNGEVTSLNLPTGRHTVTLTVTDSSGDVNTDTTIISVLSAEFPSLTSITPNNGYFGGGTQVTLTGSSFTSVFGIRFGQVVLSSQEFTIINSTTIVTTSPFSGVSVPSAVSVINPSGESNSRRFTYLSTIPIRFNAAKLLDMEDPTAVAFGPDSKLYVGNLKGQLGRYTLNEKFDMVLNSVITTINPNRGIHGIAFDPLEDADILNPTVYISTSDIFHNEPRNSIGDAVNGKIQTVTGANLDIVADIVTGLPVSGLDHSVNGIYFGNDGELYICVGSNTNGGIPGELTRNLLMRENYFSAAILVANVKKPNFNGFITYSAPNDGNPITGFGPDGVEVFASGTRNPFGVVLHSNGLIYATENGPNPGFGDMATGCGPGQVSPDVYDSDELNLIERGKFYGHPNHKRAETDPRQCVWRGTSVPTSAEYTAPLMKLRSSTDGIIEYEASYFNNEMRGNLIASKYKDGLFRIVLNPDGRSVAAFSNPAIELTGDNGLAVTMAPNGNLIDARYETSECYVHIPDEPPTTSLQIYSIFPRRGKVQGGSTLSIYGTNFADTVSVLVGGLACTNVQWVSSNLIKCTIPPSANGTVGRRTIEVWDGTVQASFVDGYNYVLGRPI